MQQVPLGRTLERMGRKRSFGIAIVLFAAILFQGTYATAALTISTVQAAVCCAGSCRHAGSLNHAARCCHLQQAAQDPATVAKVKPLPPQFSFALLLPRDTVRAASVPSREIRPIREVFARPAPIFLLDRSLRL